MMLSADIRLKMVATLSQINNSCSIIRGSLELPEMPDESYIATIADGAGKLLLDLISLQEENKKSALNKDSGLCEFYSITYDMCMAPCGKCPTESRLDCGARWKDGHPVHIGPCSYIIKAV
jgi:hypothetical protein